MSVTADAMRAAARALLDAAPAAALPYGHPDRRWLEYRPRPRPGVPFTDLDVPARKAAHRLLATGLSPHAYAQAMSIIALEEVLDRQEGWSRGRHSDDYHVVVFGDPTADDPWTWRLEGHHLSVTMTVDGGTVHPAPVFFGANPHAVRYAGTAVLRPLAVEEDVARALVEAMGPARRVEAVVRSTPPPDIHSGPTARAPAGIEPVGVGASTLDRTSRALLDRLVAAYLARLPEGVTVPVDPDRLHFAWEGSILPGQGHYYRIQAPDLLIEYDNTANDANHAHTVLRRPRSDFGRDAGADAGGDAGGDTAKDTAGDAGGDTAGHTAGDFDVLRAHLEDHP